MNVVVLLTCFLCSGVAADITFKLGSPTAMRNALAKLRRDRAVSGAPASPPEHESPPENPYANSHFTSRNRDAPAEKIRDYLDVAWETEEITTVTNFIKFKLQEFIDLMTECVLQCKSEAKLSVLDIKKECVGGSFDVLFRTYREGLNKVKHILYELVKMKLQTLNVMFDEEIAFFLDTLDQVVESDFAVAPTLKSVFARAAKYYVSPERLRVVVDASKPELKAFSELHDELRKMRVRCQLGIDEMLANYVPEEPEEGEGEEEGSDVSGMFGRHQEEESVSSGESDEEASGSGGSEKEGSEGESEGEGESGEGDEEGDEEGGEEGDGEPEDGGLGVESGELGDVEDDADLSGLTDNMDEPPTSEGDSGSPGDSESGPETGNTETDSATDSSNQESPSRPISGSGNEPLDSETDTRSPVQSAPQQPAQGTPVQKPTSPAPQGFTPKKIFHPIVKASSDIVNVSVDGADELLNSSVVKGFSKGISSGLKVALAPMMAAAKMTGLGRARARKARQNGPIYITSKAKMTRKRRN